jgi:hypothetical protein
MKNLYTNKLCKWFFKKYFDIDKDVFKVEKNFIYYWVDKENGIIEV